MILTKDQIIQEVNRKTITIDPFDRACLNPNSYNYRLGDKICEAPLQTTRELALPNIATSLTSEGMKLIPGRVYLAHTAEVIGSKKFVTSLIGRSSVGRLGLFVQLSADLGNLGSAHCWTLELACVQPTIVYPGMVIGQVSFWVPVGDIVEYDGRYTDYSLPTGNLMEMYDDPHRS